MAVDWGRVEHQYITSQTSYRRLAAEHEVNYTEVYKHGVAGSWVKKRREFIANTLAKAIQESEKATTQALVDSNECLRQACVNLSQVILRKTEVLLKTMEPDSKEISEMAKTLNTQLSSNALVFGAPDDGTIKLVLSDELKGLAR